MSSPNRNLAAGIPDIPLGFLDSPDYDEAFGPRNFAHRHTNPVMSWGNAYTKGKHQLRKDNQ